MYLVFRGDLKLTKGKIAAQAGHAVQLVLQDLYEFLWRSNEPQGDRGIDLRAWQEQWKSESYAKVALVVPDGTAMKAMKDALTANDVFHAVVTDEGRTCVEPGTETCLAIAPMPRYLAHPFVGHLKLY